MDGKTPPPAVRLTRIAVVRGFPLFLLPDDGGDDDDDEGDRRSCEGGGGGSNPFLFSGCPDRH